MVTNQWGSNKGRQEHASWGKSTWGHSEKAIFKPRHRENSLLATWSWFLAPKMQEKFFGSNNSWQHKQANPSPNHFFLSVFLYFLMLSSIFKDSWDASEPCIYSLVNPQLFIFPSLSSESIILSPSFWHQIMASCCPPPNNYTSILSD